MLITRILAIVIALIGVTLTTLTLSHPAWAASATEYGPNSQGNDDFSGDDDGQ
jgi:hypothetical protein